MHDVIIVGIPVLAIILGVFFNRHDVSQLESRMDARFAQFEYRFGQFEGHFAQLESRMEARFNAMDVRFDNLHRDMHEFYRILGEHGARIEGIEKKIS